MQLPNPLRTLSAHGQSVWLDYIERRLLTTNALERLVEQDGVCGVTSNPAIFERAITGSRDYQNILDGVDARRMDAQSLYERAALRDIRDAADVLHGGWHFLAAVIRTAEPDAGIGRRRLERQGDLVA